MPLGAGGVAIFGYFETLATLFLDFMPFLAVSSSFCCQTGQFTANGNHFLPEGGCHLLQNPSFGNNRKLEAPSRG
jgi:hypothetical protein